MRRLLLLEAGGTAGEDLLDAARALDVAACVATHVDLFRRYAPSIREKIALPVFTDFSRPEVALADLVRFCRKHAVDGVIAGMEFLSPVATRLAAVLGLPSNDPERADACRNKRLMALAFAAHGAPAPRTIAADSLASAERQLAASDFVFPLVVKPAEDAGSVNVTIVESQGALERAFALAQSKPYSFPHGIRLETTVLIQEYLPGDEFSVETIAFAGRYHHLAVTQKFCTEGDHRAEQGHTVPAPVSAMARSAILEAAEKGLQALGIRFGVSHAELKLLPDGQAKIIEIAARPPGGHIMKLVRHALGIDEARAYIQAALGDEPDVAVRIEQAAAIRFLTPPRAGVFKGVVDLDRIAADPAVIATSVYFEPGHAVGEPRDNIARLGHVLFKADSPAVVNRVAEELLRSVRVEVE